MGDPTRSRGAHRERLAAPDGGAPLHDANLGERHASYPSIASFLHGSVLRPMMTEKALYERLGGVFAIAAVVDHFSDKIVENPLVGRASKNAQLREWHTKQLDRLPGLKFMRTLWVCVAAGGPQTYVATKPGMADLGLEEAHRNLRISSAEFDEVAAELARTLEHFKIPAKEKGEVLAAFSAHKNEVIAGATASVPS